MKFGICMSVEDAIRNFPEHADYIEVHGTHILSYDDQKFLDIKRNLKSAGIKALTSNCLFPSDLRLTGEDVDFNLINEHVKKLFYRLSELGVEGIIFGSGKAKHVPNSFNRERAWEQLCELGLILSQNAAEYSQKIYVEALSYDEVNIINTLSETSNYIKQVGCSNFLAVVDFYHFNKNNEDFCSLKEHRDIIAHTHIASPILRSAPKDENDILFFEKCISVLHDIGYDKAMSFEGAIDRFEIEPLLVLLKKLQQKCLMK